MIELVVFAYYSRRVDRRFFSKINDWLGERNYTTDPENLTTYIGNAGKKTVEEFFNVASYPKVHLERKQSYPPLKYEFRFASPLTSGFGENDEVYGDAYLNYSLSAPAVVMFSGWLDTATDYTHLATQLRLAGRNLWVMDLPYHIRRTPGGYHSGELSLTGDIIRTLECIRQAVVDARILIAVLREMGSRDLALLGFSLGAWVGALLSVVEPGVSGAVLATPPIRPDELLLKSFRFSAIRAGIPDRVDELLDSIQRLFLPKELSPAVNPERIYLIGGHEDFIGSPEVVGELARCWGCNCKILPGGHISVYVTRRFWREILYILDIGNEPG
ncbi:alpha/beta hydrolase [candidate division WOR-3 bacterium]|nr:alpha/beta hydrolase [candidate division WOR-3 bacterium]